VPAGFVPVEGVAEVPELSELFDPLSAAVVEVEAELLSLLPDSLVVFFCVLL
jgi:hypothetical protein